MDTLYAVLNPSLESVRDVGEWAEKTDKYAHIVSEILNASEEVVIMQHSGMPCDINYYYCGFIPYTNFELD